MCVIVGKMSVGCGPVMVGINIVDLTAGPFLVLHFHHAVHAQIFMIHEFVTAKLSVYLIMSI